jgi:uridine kinase
MAEEPLIVGWGEAPGVIGRLVSRVESEVVVVGIGGPVGAGKSTLAGMLSSCVVSTDSYLPDYEAVEYERRDDPEASDLGLLGEHLVALRAGRAAWVPVWSYEVHRRVGERAVAPAPVVVCEGLHALHGSVRGALDVVVYVDAPREVRWARWAAMERSGQRGWGVEVAREFFERVAEPVHARVAGEHRSAADVVVANEGSGETRRT